MWRLCVVACLAVWLCALNRLSYGDPIMKIHDQDDDGYVNKTEFRRALKVHKHDHTPGEASEAFQKADANVDGLLTLTELKEALGSERTNEFKRKMDRYLWPLGMIACPLLWVNTAYFTAKIVAHDDMSSVTTGSALGSLIGGVLLIVSFQRNWDFVVDLAGFFTVGYLCVYFPIMAYREISSAVRPKTE